MAPRAVPDPNDVRVASLKGTQDQREGFALAVILLGAALVVGIWWADNPAHGLHTFADQLTAAGRITGLVGTYLILVQVVLMARLPWLDRWIGTDRLALWHRANGQYTIALLVAHAVLIVWGYAGLDHTSVAHETSLVIRSYTDALAATVGLAMLIAVGVTSARIARRRLRYETWYFVHLYTYIAIALSFSHQLATGDDFVAHPFNRALWIGLFGVVFGLLLFYRVALPVRDALRYQLRVAEIRDEGGGAVSLFVTGRDVERMGAQAGQFFRWRFLDRHTWWEAHPFSLSTAPNGRYLRVTVKGVGDHSQALRYVRPGTRVMAEGPYGNLTAQRRTRRRVAFIAGGVGITPLRALLENITAAPGELALLYRATSDGEVLFRKELERLANRRGAEVHVLVGPRTLRPDPLGPRALRHYVPDIAERDVYVCGPPGMMDRTTKSLRSLGVPRAQTHRERFEL